MKRVPGVKVTPYVITGTLQGALTQVWCRYHGKIQDHPPNFYGQFDIVIAGLDSISARRWINATLVQIGEENSENIMPLIDGGTEGGTVSALRHWLTVLRLQGTGSSHHSHPVVMLRVHRKQCAL